MMTKKVNIYPTIPIVSVNPPIRSRCFRVTKTVEDIRICIMMRATVEEILDDGSIINLTLNNYDKDNNKSKEKMVIEPPKPEPVLPPHSGMLASANVEQKTNFVKEEFIPENSTDNNEQSEAESIDVDESDGVELEDVQDIAADLSKNESQVDKFNNKYKKKHK